MNLKEHIQDDIKALIREGGFSCDCGKTHRADHLKYLSIRSHAVEDVIEGLAAAGSAYPFLVMDRNTETAAGKTVMEQLDRAGIRYQAFCFEEEGRILPNEVYLEQLMAAFTKDCDLILGIGSGVINDLCKMLGMQQQIPTGIVGTAPSMDGYASNSAAMELGGVKTTVYTPCPIVVICDTEVMRHAPMDMICSGFGDMAAKIIALSDWKIASYITGEYYCPHAARIMERSCHTILDSIDQILNREECGIRAMAEGLVLSGITMAFTEVSRPASGMEHTVSHLMEMLALQHHREPAFHGIQVGYGTRLAFRLYRYMKEYPYDEVKSRSMAAQFDEGVWEQQLRDVFKDQAEVMIRNAILEKRNEYETVVGRIEAIYQHLPEILQEIEETLSYENQVLTALDRVKIPQIQAPQEPILGFTTEEVRDAYRHSKDLRARYIFTSFCHDVGAEGWQEVPFL